MQSNKFESIKIKAANCNVRSRPRRKSSPDLSVESAVVSVSMQAISRMSKMRSTAPMSILLAAFALAFFANARADVPNYEIEQGVALADSQNPEVIIARKKLEAARGGLIEARSGYLPSVVSSG